ncbi:MAG: heme-binding protein, partial [Janthinobacterium lividum]
CSTQDAPASQADWIRRKRNSVLRFGRSSYALGLELEQIGQTMEQRHGLPVVDYAMHGGGFPILLTGTGLVGTIIASGLPQRDDHIFVITALAQLTGIEVPQLT